MMMMMIKLLVLETPARSGCRHLHMSKFPVALCCCNDETDTRAMAVGGLCTEQVRRRSVAERAGVKVGDLVLAIDDVTTSNLTHCQMLELISYQRLALQLTLSRYVVIHIAYSLTLLPHAQWRIKGGGR